MFEGNNEYKKKIISLMTGPCCNAYEMSGDMGMHEFNIALLTSVLYDQPCISSPYVSLNPETFGQILGRGGDSTSESSTDNKKKKKTHILLFNRVLEKFSDKMVSISSGYYLLPTDIGLLSFLRVEVNEHDAARSIRIHTWNTHLEDELCKFIADNFQPEEINGNTGKNTYKLAYASSFGITTRDMNFRPVDCDINKNYNDDLPYDRIMQLLDSDKQQLIMFYGAAGTGKTTLIKHLINDNSDKRVVVVDTNLLTTMGDDKLLNFISNNTNSIFVLEDCDKVLQSREKGNQTMSTILNLTDGLVGEAFNIKFICTFNTSLKDVDQAIFRKGRLSLMYEFKPLSLEKTKKIIPDATKEMTLADIYNPENNIINGSSSSKIGF